MRREGSSERMRQARRAKSMREAAGGAGGVEEAGVAAAEEGERGAGEVFVAGGGGELVGGRHELAGAKQAAEGVRGSFALGVGTVDGGGAEDERTGVGFEDGAFSFKLGGAVDGEGVGGGGLAVGAGVGGCAGEDVVGGVEDEGDAGVGGGAGEGERAEMVPATAQSQSDSQRSTSVAPARAVDGGEAVGGDEVVGRFGEGDGGFRGVSQSGEGGRRAAGMAEGPSWQSAAPSSPEAPRTRMRSDMRLLFQSLREWSWDGSEAGADMSKSAMKRVLTPCEEARRSVCFTNQVGLGLLFEITGNFCSRGFQMKLIKNLGAAVVCLLLASGALSSQAQQTWQATLGAQSKDMGTQAIAFLPNELWIHVGDSVSRGPRRAGIFIRCRS